MSRADLEAAAEEKYPTVGYVWGMRAAYIQGRLDQAEADAQIAEDPATLTLGLISESTIQAGNEIAAEIRKESSDG